MTDLRKAAEMALEAFQSCRWDCDENNEPQKTFNDILVSRASEALHAALAQPEQAHTDHPMRHWDRTCPACVAQPWDTSDMAYRPNGLSVEQEPVAWDGDCVLGHCGAPDGCDRSGCCRADTAPPSKPWVSLTENEIELLWCEPEIGRKLLQFARAIEAALRSKNNG